MSTTEPDAIKEILCVSLGIVILDEIRMPNKPPLVNVIGGSATFVTLGLRLFAPHSRLPGCLVMAGSDFPSSIRDEIRSWRTRLVIKESPDRESSRGLLTYTDDTLGPKTFSYTTPPIRPTPSDLVGTPLLRAQAFHFFGRPEEVSQQVPELLRLRCEAHPELAKPFIVWEPLPSACAPDVLDAFRTACGLVDVFSPNHMELAALFAPDDVAPETGLLARLEIQGRCLVRNGTGTLIVRAGVDGALAMRHDEPTVHVPAFHAKGSDKVVDATGAGNAFLGGYIAGWLREGSVKEALCYGAVASSFAIEQIGLPAPEEVSAAAGEGRLAEFRRRLGT
jgi:sugar/nucleoside kinase (ribokinase family)